MEVKLKKNAKRFSLVIGAVVLAFFALSSYYYKAPVLHPVGIWHGAQLSVLSMMSSSDSSWDELDYDKELFARISESEKDKHIAISVGGSTNARLSDIEVKNQIATSQARQAQFDRDMSRLNQANKQVLNSNETLNGLNQDLSSITAYQQAELARQQAIQNILDSEREVPSDAEANALITQRGLSSKRSESGIPEKVLTNVQKTTGISPEEINELMNK